MDELDVHAEARGGQDERLRHADGLLVAGRVGPADRDRLALEATLLLDDGHQVGQGLEGVVDLALHVEHGHPAGRGHVADVLVALAEGDVSDGDAVAVATQDLADLGGRVAVRDLRGAALDEHGVPAQLRHAGLERGTRAGAREEEEHREHPVAQVGVGLAQGPLALQVEGHVERGLDLLVGPVGQVDEVSTAESGLHRGSSSGGDGSAGAGRAPALRGMASGYSAAPRMSESRLMRMTTPLKASTQ